MRDSALRWLAATVSAALLVAAGCSGDRIPASPAATATTAAEDFYEPPDPLPPGQPGEVIRAARTTAPPGVVAWKVLYHSTAVDGRDVAVSGLVVAPVRPGPPGGFPVVSYAHGTTGSADPCAPSKSPGTVTPLVPLALQGYVVTATDYEGLGTPGPHPYLVGVSEGRSALDAARAARHLSDAHAADRVVVWGHSQGGHAALFAGEIAASYAPDLRLVGVVAGAPAAELTSAFSDAAGSPASFGFFATLAHAWSRTYPEASLESILTPEGIRALDVVERRCIADVVRAFVGRDPSDLVKANPVAVETWARLLAENSPGSARTPAPILLVQGDRDELVPLSSTRALERRLCGLGDTVELRVYPGQDHLRSAGASATDVVAWIGARLAGSPPSVTCGG